MNTLRLAFVSAATIAGFAIAGLGQTPGHPTPQLRLHQTEEAVFPATLLAQGVTSGEAWIVVSLDADGRLTDALPSRFTQRALADEALRVLPHWRFDPVEIDGRPTAVCTQVRFAFKATGCIVTLDSLSALQQATGLDIHSWQTHVCAAADLDRLPVRLVPAAADRPVDAGRLAAAPATTAQRVVLEFIVDETGRPRMPMLISAPDTLTGNRAAAELETWRFTPPTRRGQPVAVRLRQEFVFRSNDT